MSTFKNINKSSTLIEKNVVSFKHTFTTASVGIQSIKIVSGSISQSYWDSLNVMFYTSGSPVYGSETKLELDNFSYKDRKQHLRLYKFDHFETTNLRKEKDNFLKGGIYSLHFSPQKY